MHHACMGVKVRVNVRVGNGESESQAKCEAKHIQVVISGCIYKNIDDGYTHDRDNVASAFHPRLRHHTHSQTLTLILNLTLTIFNLTRSLELTIDGELCTQDATRDFHPPTSFSNWLTRDNRSGSHF